MELSRIQWAPSNEEPLKNPWHLERCQLRLWWLRSSYGWAHIAFGPFNVEYQARAIHYRLFSWRCMSSSYSYFAKGIKSINSDSKASVMFIRVVLRPLCVTIWLLGSPGFVSVQIRPSVCDFKGYSKVSRQKLTILRCLTCISKWSVLYDDHLDLSRSDYFFSQSKSSVKL